MLRGKRGRRMLRWANGLTWEDLATDTIVKETTKTGAMIAHDLTLCPMTRALISLVPAEARVGPLIVDERAGRPYAKYGYAREWRVVARAAAIPDHVWNMDARAGAITEAEDAGAELDTILRCHRPYAGVNDGAIFSWRSRKEVVEVARLRQAHRAECQ